MAGLTHTRRRGNEINRDLVIKLSETGSFTVKDSDGFTIWGVDAVTGDMTLKGKTVRPTTG